VPETWLHLSPLSSLLLSLELGYKIFTRENGKSRAELWGWDLEKGWACWEPAQQWDLEQGSKAGTRLRTLMWENKGLTAHQMGS